VSALIVVVFVFVVDVVFVVAGGGGGVAGSGVCGLVKKGVFLFQCTDLPNASARVRGGGTGSLTTITHTHAVTHSLNH
jgi:hypothetical protein